jgi:hypothetical protein
MAESVCSTGADEIRISDFVQSARSGLRADAGRRYCPWHEMRYS